MILYSKVSEVVDNDPVTLAEAKEHLEVSGTRRDTYITTLISVARELCEKYSGLSFVTQERSIKLDYFPLSCHEGIIVPYGPIQSIDTFTYIDNNGATQTLTEGTDFYADTHSGLCRLYAIDDDGAVTYWPSDAICRPGCITITYTAGYDDVSGQRFPKAAKQAMLMQIATMFENRQDEVVGASSTVLNWSSAALLDSIKVEWNANIKY